MKIRLRLRGHQGVEVDPGQLGGRRRPASPLLVRSARGKASERRQVR
jgi:hypothetical protein